MKPKSKTIRIWKSFLDFGDLTRISKESGISRVTISKAVNAGDVSEKTIQAIQAFVDRKKAA